MFKKVKNQRLYLQIVNQIRDLIDKGNLKSSDKLPPERELTKKFNVSRATIREAMSALEILGLIESRGSQGNFIKVDIMDTSVEGALLKELLENHSPFEVFEARCEIEPIMGALAAERKTRKDLERLKKCLIILNALGRQIKIDLKKINNYMEEDRKFHLIIAKCAHNSVLFTVYSSVNLMLKEKHWKVLKKKCVTKDSNLKRFEKEHTEIFNAIYEGNTELAKINIFEHLQAIKKDMFDE